MEIRAPLRHPARTGTTGLFSTRVNLAAPIDISAGIHRMFEQVLQGHAVRLSPCQRPLGRPLTQANAQFDVVMDQITQQGMERAKVIKLAKDEVHHLLDLLVRLEANLAVRGPYIADGKRETQFTPTGFIEFALIHALFDQMQLSLTHRAF